MPKYRRLDTPVASLEGTTKGIAQQHVLHNREYVENKIAAYRELSCFQGALSGLVITAILSFLTMLFTPLLPIAIILGLCALSMGLLTIVAIVMCLWKICQGVFYLLRFLFMVIASPFLVVGFIREAVKEDQQKTAHVILPPKPIHDKKAGFKKNYAALMAWKLECQRLKKEARLAVEQPVQETPNVQETQSKAEQNGQETQEVPSSSGESATI